MKDFLFMIYACEEQKKEDFIEALAQEYDPYDTYTQAAVATGLGIDMGLWTSSDWDYIFREVDRRR